MAIMAYSARNMLIIIITNEVFSMAATSSDVQSKIAQSTVCFSIFLPAGDRSKTYHIEFFFEKNDLSQSVFGVSVSEFGKILSQDIQLERLMVLGC